MDGTSIWDLPLWVSVFSSDSSSGTARTEKNLFDGTEEQSDAKSVFDRAGDFVGWVARLSGSSTGRSEDCASLQGSDHRPVAGMAECIKSQDFPGCKARRLRSAENKLGRECFRTEFVDRRSCDRRNACADDRQEIEHKSRVVARREMDRVSFRPTLTNRANRSGQETTVCQFRRWGP